jgi:predicted Zn-dependent peptidase
LRQHASAGITCLIALGLALSANAATVNRTTLDNGLTVLVVENDSAQVVGVALLVKASALDEIEYGIGSRAILQQIILTAGHQDLTGLAEVASATISRQSGFGVHTDHDLAEAWVSLSPDEIDAGLARLRGYVFAPPLTDETLKQAREFVHQGYDAAHRSPVQVTYELFRAAFYGPGPLAGPLEGDNEDVDRVTLDALTRLHSERYVASNAVVCVVSPLPASETLAAIERALGDLPKRPAPPITPLPALPEESLVEVEGRTDMSHSSLVVGVPLADPAAENAIAGELIAQVLEGPAGRLRRDRALFTALGLVIPSRVIEEHYPIAPLPIPLTRQPYLALHAMCAADNIERTRVGLLRQLLALRTGSVSDTEMELARKRLINSHALRYLKPSDAALRLAQREAFGMPLETDAELNARVAAISREDLTAYAVKHFTRHAIGLQMPMM